MVPLIAASEVAHWSFRIALFLAGLALLCVGAWGLLWWAGKVFAQMYPRDKGRR